MIWKVVIWAITTCFGEKHGIDMIRGRALHVARGQRLRNCRADRSGREPVLVRV